VATRTPQRLGNLETDVLEALWASATPVSVRDVLALVRRRPPLAYTTVLTVLDRLHAKGLVERRKDGKAFLYWARTTREAWLGDQAAGVLLDGPPEASVLMAFLDSAERADPELLDRLSALIEARRRTPR
jgi:predicted transcriptional regulator